jgi:hypothetical protein
MAHGGGNRPNAGRKPGSATKKTPRGRGPKGRVGRWYISTRSLPVAAPGCRPLATSDRVQDVCCRFLR